MTLTAAWFWPSVGSRKDSLFAIDEAFWISAAVSVFTLIFVLIEFLRAQESSFDILGLIISLFFAGAAFGIRRRSRLAATVGLVMYILLGVFLLPPTGLGSPTIGALITLALLHSVCGTFSYHKLPALPVGMLSIEQSFRAVTADSRGPNEGTPQQ